MTVRWVFTRGYEVTRIEVASIAHSYTISVHRSSGVEHRTSLPSVLEAMLQQAHLERALTISGWQLAEFVRLAH